MPARVPPHDLAAEVSILGSLLIDPEAMLKVADILRPESFYDERHKLIFESMWQLFDQRQPIDAVTLSNQLKKNKNLKTIGGAATVAELSNSVTSSAHVVNYAKLVADMSMKRILISTSGEISELAFDDSKEVQDLMDLVEQRVFSLSQKQSNKAFIPIKETLAESFERLDELQRMGGEMRGVQTGFQDLDNLLSGLQKSNLVILAARPGVGKTAFALNITQFASIVGRKKIGFFSLEMSKEELVDRLLVGQADIDAWRLKTGRLDQQDFLKLSDAMGVLADAQIFIDDSPGLSIYEMRTKARRLMLEHQIDLLIVDYLQLASGRTKDNRVQEVAEISQGLKNVARELRIPVIALSQLSRAVESRGEKTPQLSDLRESGSIEQDADVVMFLYRKDEDIREMVTLKIAKHRNGPLGEVDLYFRGERIKFFGMEQKRPA
jgi:replicative DNA helicase